MGEVDALLRELVEEGLVREKNKTYSLTSEGLKHAAYMQDHNLTKVEQPLMAVFSVVRRGGEVLLNRRKKQPFFGYIGFPGGKLELGETLAERMKIELEEETGLKADSQRLGAIVSTRIFDSQKKMTGHNMMFFFLVDEFKGKLLPEVEEGENFWWDASRVSELKPLYPDVVPVIEAMEKNKPIFIEMTRVENGSGYEGRVLEDYLA